MKMKNGISKIFGFALVFVATKTFGQIATNGTYQYEVAFAEWSGKSLGSTVTVMITADLVKIINNGTLPGRRGDLIEKGKIMKISPVIATKLEDEFANGLVDVLTDQE